MKKNKPLYHGSNKAIVGDLIPKQPTDLGNRLENLHKAVYASDIKEIAIAMAIISSNGVYTSSLNFNKKPYGVIYNGWPKQEYVYLYILPPESFKKNKNNPHQSFSETPVKPLKVKKLRIEKYLPLIGKASETETEKFHKKHKIPIRK